LLKIKKKQCKGLHAHCLFPFFCLCHLYCLSSCPSLSSPLYFFFLPFLFLSYLFLISENKQLSLKHGLFKFLRLGCICLFGSLFSLF